MEWNFSKPEGLKKGRIRYTFEGDLNLNDYLKYLEDLGFKILEVVDMPELLEFKDNSPAKMILLKIPLAKILKD